MIKFKLWLYWKLGLKNFLPLVPNDHPLYEENIANNENNAQEEPKLRRSTLSRRYVISDDYIFQIEFVEMNIKVLVSYSQAIKDDNSDKWIDAMKDEMSSRTEMKSLM